jgi:methylated-DNA-protein-cysteine methyltransferase related protein
MSRRKDDSYQRTTGNPATQRKIARKKEDRAPRFFVHVYRLVSDVPKGKVVTYGQVAALLGAPRAARAVGTALRYLPRPFSRTVPWQRVINAAGGISLRGDVGRAEEQRWLLEAEGIEFDRQGKVNLKRYRWSGPQRRKAPVWKTQL